MRVLLRPLLATAALGLNSAAWAQSPGSLSTADSVNSQTDRSATWQVLETFPEPVEAARQVRPSAGQALLLNWAPLLQTLNAAPREADVPVVARSATVVAVPRPDGVMERFALVESSIMQPELQAMFPDIRTYLGQGVDRPAATLRLDRTPQGLHAQVLAPSAGGKTGVYYIDPVLRGDTSYYVSHWRGALGDAPAWQCFTPQPDPESPALRAPGFQPRGTTVVRRREYRLAMAATGEYTTFASLPGPSNVLSGLGAVVTTVNRVNQILENDCAVRLLLVAGNSNIIFTDPNTDPYSGTIAQMQGQNSGTLQALIGLPNYDIGHVVNAIGGGGNAGGIATVCNDALKSAGYTSLTSPTGDAFWVDYVAHEIGHQLGGTHTFNGTQGNCTTGAWTGGTAYEPGSGSTVMSYAGTCQTDNIATNVPPAGASSPMYGFINIDQIRLIAATNLCTTAYTPTGNNFPVPFVGRTSYIVPTNTPFSLLGSASDPDFGNSISYSWEQADKGPQRALGPDTGFGEPLLRTFMHTSDNERQFPALSTQLTGTALPGENLPLFARSSTFKLVVRDNVAGAGGTGSASVSINFAPSTGGGFRVTQPAGGTVCRNNPVPVVWNVAGTQSTPVSCSLVDITMSIDGGQTFPIALAAGVANSGFALVTLPPLDVASARIRVSAVDNIFYAINPASFKVQSQAPQFTGPLTWPACDGACPGTRLRIPTPAVTGSAPLTLTLEKQSGSTWTALLAAAPGGDFDLGFLAKSDTGVYRIAASNACGTVYTPERRLDVGVSVQSATGAGTVAPCAPVTLAIQARGVCSLSYQWVKNGQPIATDPRISGVNTPTLTINGARFEDEGDYACRITDTCETYDPGPMRLSLTTPVWVQAPMNASPTFAASGEKWVAAYDESRGVTVLYGGATQTGQNSNSLWEYDGATWTVRQSGFPFVNTTSGQFLYDGLWPPNPDSSAMVYCPDDRKVYLIGPYGSTAPLAIFTWDGTSWGRPYYGPVMGNSPARTHAVWDSVNRRIVIVRSVDGTNNSELLTYDPATNTMTGPIAMQPGVQAGVVDSALWFDQRRGAAIWYNNFNQFVAPTMWSLSAGTQWQHIPGTPQILAYATPVVYDPIRFQGVGIGGQIDNGVYFTGTTAWPNVTGNQPWNPQMPAANSWGPALPDGPPRNPAGAGISPPNNWRPAFWGGLVFDTKRRALVGVGRSLIFTPFAFTWATYERRYLDRVVFDRPPNTETLPSNAVRFSAAAAGFPALAYQWRRNGAPIADGPSPSGGAFSGAQSAQLTLTGAAAADNGNYTLSVTNACGTVTSTPVRLGCAADFDQSGVRDVSDIFAFLSAWFANDPRADLDGNGRNVQDIFTFLSLWFAGC